jgi:hypothetical protein
LKQEADYLSATIMGSNYFKSKLRENALCVMLSAFQPHFSLQYATTALGFQSTSECKEFLTNVQLVLVEDRVLTKESKKTFNAFKNKSKTM